MIKTLIKGFVFGLGFCLAIWAYSYAVNQYNSFGISKSTHSFETTSKWNNISMSEQSEWRKLSINGKINKCSGAALIRFRDEADGLRSAYVDKIFTKLPTTSLNIKVNQRVEKFDYYSNKGSRDRNGLIVLFTQHPDREMDTLFMYDDRLISIGDMPLKTFLKKFEQSKSGKLSEKPHVSQQSIKDSSPTPSIAGNFHSLTTEERIQRSTAILLTELKRNKDGKLMNHVVEVLKKDDGIDLYYEAGDDYEAIEYPSEVDTTAIVGHIVFMESNPAEIRHAVSYTDKRVRELDDIPLALLKQKCKAE